jgi:hypothetical protein
VRTMTTTEKLLDHIPDFMRKEPGSNNYQFMVSFAPEIDDVKASVQQMRSGLKVSTATGAALDAIGALFLLGRQPSEGDEPYRGRILAYWESYSGGGTFAAIKQAMADILGVTPGDITITEVVPCKIRVTGTMDIGDAALAQTAADQLQNVKAAGMWALFNARLTGFNDGVTVSDAVSAAPTSAFIIEESLIDGDDLIG